MSNPTPAPLTPSHPQPPAPPDFPFPARYVGLNLPNLGPLHVWAAASPYNLLDERVYLEEFEQKSELMPYFCELWPCALFLSHRFATQPDSISPDWKVLELGAGLGMCGLTLGKLGCDVTLTDLATDSLRILKIHLRENGLDPSGRCRVESLDLLENEPSSVPEHAFDFIVASDLVFESRMCRPLCRMIDRYLKPGGRAIIADQDRSTAKTLPAELDAAGFDWRAEEYSHEKMREMGLRDMPIKIRIFHVNQS